MFRISRTMSYNKFIPRFIIVGNMQTSSLHHAQIAGRLSQVHTNLFDDYDVTVISDGDDQIDDIPKAL